MVGGKDLRDRIPIDTGLTVIQLSFATQTIYMEKITIETFQVIGIAVRTCNTDGTAAQDIPALWGRFMSEGLAEKIPNRVNDAVFCIYTDYEGDYQQPYLTLLGCQVKDLSQIPEGMVGKEIANANYEHIKVVGDISGEAIYGAWTKIWASDLDRAYLSDFEVYSADQCQSANPSIDIYVSVK